MSASGCLVYHEAARFLIIVNFMFTGSNIRHTAMVCEVSVLLNNALKTSTQILSRLVFGTQKTLWIPKHIPFIE